MPYLKTSRMSILMALFFFPNLIKVCNTYFAPDNTSLAKLLSIITFKMHFRP